MAKITTWRIPTDGGEAAEHIITYSLNKFTGRMTVTLDGDEFALSAGFLSLKAARREPFRIVGEDGEAEQAILVVDKKGRAKLIFRSKEVLPEKQIAVYRSETDKLRMQNAECRMQNN